MSQYVVDAKWLLPEVHGAAALQLLDGSHPLVVPDLLLVEVGNVLWKRLRRGEITGQEATTALTVLLSLPLQVHAAKPLLPLALAIASGSGRTVYDSLYIAAAMVRECAVVTADRRFHDAVKRSRLAEYIVWVTEAP